MFDNPIFPYVAPLLFLPTQSKVKLLLYSIAGGSLYSLVYGFAILSLIGSTLLCLIIGCISIMFVRREFIQTIKNVAAVHSGHELELAPWTEKWDQEVEKEKQRVEAVLLPEYGHLVDRNICPDGIVHIGSTSIKHIKYAKPFHDMGLAITTDTLPDGMKELLVGLGYTYIGAAPHNPNGDDRWFMLMVDEKDRPERGLGFDIHVVLRNGHEGLEDLIYYSKYMNTFPEEREKYEKIKEEIKNSGIKDLGNYQIQKGKRLIELRLLEKSKEWKNQQKLQQKQK